jgi:hypothetical protein
MSLRSAYQSRITNHRSRCLLTFHLSPLPLLTSHQSPLTSRGRASGPMGQSMQNPGVLRFVIKKWQMAIKFRITIEESFGSIHKLSCRGFETKIGCVSFSGSSLRDKKHREQADGPRDKLRDGDHRYPNRFSRKESSFALGSASRSSPTTPVGAVHISEYPGVLVPKF